MQHFGCGLIFFGPLIRSTKIQTEGKMVHEMSEIKSAKFELEAGNLKFASRPYSAQLENFMVTK